MPSTTTAAANSMQIGEVQFGATAIREVPEPATVFLLASGLASVAAAARRRQRKR